MFTECATNVEKAVQDPPGRLIMDECKEHARYTRLNQPNKSVLAEHALPTNHYILFSVIHVIVKSDNFKEQGIWNAIEIQLDNIVFH